MKKELSVFFIVRNEQDVIAEAIKSVRKFANEVIVVDTGSVDRTIELAKACKAKIYRYKWDNDFSAVRNFALSKCTKEWVMYLDADEFISSEDGQKIQKLIQNTKGDCAFLFSINDYLGKTFRPENIVKQPYSKSPQIRLFKNNKAIQFHGKVHESVEDCVYKLKNFTIKNSGISINHHLFRGDPVKYRNKKESYYKQLSAKVVEPVKNNNSENDPKSKEKCAIIVAVHNLLKISKRCIESIECNTRYPFKLIVVDNGSDKDKMGSFLDSLIDVEVIRIDSNKGVAKARNEGVKVAMKDKDVKYICLLDNDTEVVDGWLTNLIDFLDKNPNCSMVGPITNSAMGDQRKVKQSWVGKYSTKEIVDKVVKKGVKSFQKVNFINRFCQVFKKDLIRDIGFLDESFGLIGWEERDFCKRVIDSGGSIYIDKSTYVYHRGQSTSTFNNLSYLGLMRKSSAAYHRKWNNETKKSVLPPEPDELNFTSIVVLTYNNLNINKRFFDAIKKFTDGHKYEMIVVDNGSTDGTLDYLETLDWIRLVKNPENLGVIKARNIGLNMARGNHLICLDNDQIVKANWLDYLYKKIDEGFDFVGVEAWEVGSHYMPIKRHTSKRRGLKIDYVGAGGCLMKRSVLEDVGLYDERFGMAYFEDVDICYRAREKGYRVGWCDSNIINHLEHSTLIKSQKDFSYSDALSNSHKIFRNKMIQKSRGKIFKEIPLQKIDRKVSCEVDTTPYEGEKFITLCMCLKGRSERAIKSIRSIVNDFSYQYMNFIITEDISDDLLDLSDFEHKDKITHYLVDSGVSWTRSGMLNYGFKRADTKFVSAWDADFLFEKNYPKEIHDLLLQFNEKNILQVDCCETDDCYINGNFHKKGSFYGGVYFYGTETLKSIRGFDEKFIDWGKEERDFENRYFRKTGGSIIMASNLVDGLKVHHMSHSDEYRGITSNSKKNLDRELKSQKSPRIVANRKWGEQKLIMKSSAIKDRDTIVVMGNGPSLNVDFSIFDGYHTFGMNGAYRYYYENKWWPTYFGCFDDAVTDCHEKNWKSMIEDKNVPIKRYFLRKNISNNEKLTVLRVNSNKIGEFSDSFSSFGYGGNTGANCCQAAICMGYKKIVLIGVECNYVEVVDGAEKNRQGRLQMQKTPDSNPNYFFGDYQREGDVYNFPRADIFHQPAWEALAKFAKSKNVDIVNCSPISKLTCFRKSTLEEELI